MTTPKEGTIMDLDALLTRAEQRRDESWETTQVVLADEILTVAIARTDGRNWVDLKAQHQPRTAEDHNRGYDSQAISRVYPRVRVNSIDIAPDAWTRLYDALDVENQGTIDAVVWGVNVFTPQRARMQTLVELRKTELSEADTDTAATDVAAPQDTTE